MSISQVSVFVESKPGHLARVLEAFENADVNVRGFSAGDTGDYGIVRFIVDDTEKALNVLAERGSACSRSSVLCLRLDDKPGELSRIVSILSKCGINISYCYSMISTYIVISVKDIERAEALLAEQPVVLVSEEDLATLCSHEAKEDGDAR